MSASPDVAIVDVAARDGLQNDPAILSTRQKIDLITKCLDAGLLRQEVASFVNPNRVPRMADAEAVLEGLPDHEGASYIGLVLNLRGFERARLTRVDEVNMVVVASETFSQRNQGMSTDDAAKTVEAVVPLARDAGIIPTVTISAAYGCPYEGEVPTSRVVALAERMASAGVEEIAIADTIGVAVPHDVKERIAAVRAVTGDIRLRSHFHNTRNTGYACALEAYEAGVRVLDASLGGVGGCPFAPKATGNIATEDLVYLLERSGVNTGVDLEALLVASDWLGEQLGRPTPALVSKAGGFPRGDNAA